MTDTTETTTITWTAPGGGQWELETLHMAGALPRMFQERVPIAGRAGFQGAAARYGLPIDYLDMRFVNDHCYGRMRPVGAPEPKPGRASSPPPKLILWALARLHPELRRRARAARTALADRIWHDDLRRWQSVLRDEMLQLGRGLQAEDVAAMDDDALIDHLRRVADHLVRGLDVHFDLLPVHNIPLGRLVAGCRRWGISEADALGLLAGSSPASAGSTAALRRIVEASRAAGVEPSSLDEVRRSSSEAAAALDDYLADHGWRVVADYTPRARTLVELPDVLLQAMRAAAAVVPRPEPDAAPFRARVPETERALFDDLLADARACYGIRDDNVGITVLWPVGLMRRAILEIGRRMVDRGVLDEPEEALALGEQELADALGGDALLGDLAKRRVARGIAYEADGAPLVLGDSEGGDPDFSAFPAAMAELTAAIIDTVLLEGMVGPHVPTGWSGAGIGVGGAPYTGRACVATSPEDALNRLEPGDVLVTMVTTPAYEALMQIAGAVVTELGGLMSHTALVAREHGISALVAVTAATTAIPDGATVEVNPTAGQVRVLGS